MLVAEAVAQTSRCGGCGVAGGCAVVTVHAWETGVTVWGLVSGPCGSELVAVKLGEVVGHHL